MQAVLATTLPFFALVFMGWLAARQGWLAEAAIPGLNGFVLFFALPAMLLRFGMSTPLLELLNPVVLGVYLLAATLIVALTVALTWREPRLNLKNAAFGALVAAFPNSGFMGVPLLVALMGPAAAGPVICTVLADMIVTTSVCVGLAQSREAARPGTLARDAGPRAAALKALRGALSNPLPWSIFAGLLIGLAEVQLPGPLLRVVNMLADAASPVALFTIGAVLWRSGAAGRSSGPGHSAAPVLRQAADVGVFGDAFPSPQPLSPKGRGALKSFLPLPLRERAGVRGRQASDDMTLGSYLPVALIKLVLHPLAVAGLGLGAQALGLPLSGFQWTVLVLVAALPSASNVSLLAERYGADNGRIARIIMASTLLAFFSFSLLAGWLEVRPMA